MDKIRVKSRWVGVIDARRPYVGSPCVRLKYSFRPPVVEPGGGRIVAGRKAWGLIDTGADRSSIDEALVPEGTHPIQDVLVTGASGEVVSRNYNAVLGFPALNWILTCGLATMPHVPDRPFQIVLGRQFLQFFRFTYDGRTGLQELELVDNPAAI